MALVFGSMGFDSIWDGRWQFFPGISSGSPAGSGSLALFGLTSLWVPVSGLSVVWVTGLLATLDDNAGFGAQAIAM